MKLSVVICSWGRPKSLRRVLESLKKQSFQSFEVIVVSEEGLAEARDLGWRRAKGEITSFIDDDVILDIDWAKNLIEIFESDPKIGGVSGPTIVPEELLNNRLVFWWWKPKGKIKSYLAKLWIKVVLENRPFEVGKLTRLWWTPGSNFESSLKIKGLKEVDYLEACNMSLRRELIEKVGGFDLGFKGTSEWCEVDLAMRVKRLGYRLVFSSKVKLEHRVSQAGVYSRRRNLTERLRNYVRFRRRNIL